MAPGFKYNLTDIAAAIGLHQLKKRRRFHDARTGDRARYDEAFAGLPVIRSRPGAGAPSTPGTCT